MTVETFTTIGMILTVLTVAVGGALLIYLTITL